MKKEIQKEYYEAFVAEAIKKGYTPESLWNMPLIDLMMLEKELMNNSEIGGQIKEAFYSVLPYAMNISRV